MIYSCFSCLSRLTGTKFIFIWTHNSLAISIVPADFTHVNLSLADENAQRGGQRHILSCQSNLQLSKLKLDEIKPTLSLCPEETIFPTLYRSVKPSQMGVVRKKKKKPSLNVTVCASVHLFRGVLDTHLHNKFTIGVNKETLTLT